MIEELPLDPLDAKATDADLDRLILDAEQTYDAAARLGNLSAASQALSVRLRGLSEKAAREASREKHQELLAGADPTKPETWPSELGTFVIKYQDNILRRLSEVTQ